MTSTNSSVQALLVEKVLASSGASAEDVAKTLLIQTVLKAIERSRSRSKYMKGSGQIQGQGQ